jgi:hypothetical protein
MIFVIRESGGGATKMPVPGRYVAMDLAYEEIARRAYALFLSRGAEHGRDFDDWLEAERQLRSASTVSRNGRRSAPKPQATATKARQKRH